MSFPLLSVISWNEVFGPGSSALRRNKLEMVPLVVTVLGAGIGRPIQGSSTFLHMTCSFLIYLREQYLTKILFARCQGEYFHNVFSVTSRWCHGSFPGGTACSYPGGVGTIAVVLAWSRLFPRLGSPEDFRRSVWGGIHAALLSRQNCHMRRCRAGCDVLRVTARPIFGSRYGAGHACDVDRGSRN